MREILRVDMSTLQVTREPLPEKWARYGGRALTSAIVYSEVPADADPLGPENKLVIAPGLLGGTSAPNGGRLSVGAKSPLTGGIKEANSGGTAAHALGKMNIAAIIIEGAPADKTALYALRLFPDGTVDVVRRHDLAGLGTYETVAVAKGIEASEHRMSDKSSFLVIGPSGEMKMKSAGIAVTDPLGHPNRYAGRGGLGAVMGSKGLKLIAIFEEGLKPKQHADKDAFIAAVRKFSGALTTHAVTSQALPTFGTNVLANIINEAGGYPTRNFSSGQFEGVDGISGETMREITVERGGNVKHGCHTGCVIQCSRYYVDEDGHYMTKGPEYESAWSLGANCGIDDMDMVAKLDRKCGEIGIDTIEAGVMLGVYMASGEIAFGDGEAALKALDEIGRGTELGKVLGDGAEATGVKFGVKNIPVVKHQGLPAYDPRPIQGIGVTYATSTMGADHTAGYTITSNVLAVGGTVDPLKPEGQAALSQGLQIATAMLDAMGLCIFVAFAVLDMPEALEAIHEMAAAHTGDDWDVDALMQLGKETLAYERVFNQHAGFTAADDRLPAFFLEEKLPPHDVVFTVTDEELDSVYSFVPEVAEQLGIE
ncbi:aldehyde ferredoxin oxidoreductase family protein [Anaerosoma tenue]|uniref:aldehyde ferredoxin oxidoreductase family protein n=1 Tax=Anaerosoma tenue TaxID=2933588 RepID=UPI0022608569|nr:aldehyde ferredoxin oxidoreductase C-terminal domain-containing protein [Anaerosoma tenue]MCK8115791.1 aldehyde ferredoxin oxidoreductase [Anaerosoma tenue]